MKRSEDVVIKCVRRCSKKHTTWLHAEVAHVTGVEGGRVMLVLFIMFIFVAHFTILNMLTGPQHRGVSFWSVPIFQFNVWTVEVA